jgi:hypothetical protein
MKNKICFGPKNLVNLLLYICARNEAHMHVIERRVFSLKHITYNTEALIWVVVGNWKHSFMIVES